jgi:hypothetical protein
MVEAVKEKDPADANHRGNVEFGPKGYGVIEKSGHFADLSMQTGQG